VSGNRLSQTGTSRNMAYELVIFDADGTLTEVGKPARRFTDIYKVSELLVDELE
jgi:phosphoglycolate phosphatase-like HAD superfamily hydrolase